MAGLSMAGRYARYKQDTSIFATWLQSAGTTSGYQPPTYAYPPPIYDRTRESHVREMLLQAKALVTKEDGRITVPSHVLEAAKRAIADRKLHHRQFKIIKGTKGTHKRTDKHVYFINIMTEAVRIVESL